MRHGTLQYSDGETVEIRHKEFVDLGEHVMGLANMAHGGGKLLLEWYATDQHARFREKIRAINDEKQSLSSRIASLKEARRALHKTCEGLSAVEMIHQEECLALSQQIGRHRRQGCALGQCYQVSYDITRLNYSIPLEPLQEYVISTSNPRKTVRWVPAYLHRGSTIVPMLPPREFERNFHHHASSTTADTLVGIAYLGGPGMAKDLNLAQAYFNLAAEKRHPLGRALHLVYGSDSEAEAGVRELQELTHNGCPHASHAWHELGRCYLTGRGIVQNLEKAVECYNTSYSTGNGLADLRGMFSQR